MLQPSGVASSSSSSLHPDPELIAAVQNLSPLEQTRLQWQPPLPRILQAAHLTKVQGPSTSSYSDQAAISKLFPHTYGQPAVHFMEANGEASSTFSSSTPVRIGIVLSGGPASGGHNVISGLFDFLIQRVHPSSRLFGFLDGPSGLVDGKYIELSADLIAQYRNTGGFHIIGSGRTKIETPEQFRCTRQTVERLELDGLVVVGGDDSNTNAALLAEYFLANHCKTRCVGVPKTIDGDLRNEYLDISFGFDTATKVFSEKVAALAADAVSARKTWHICRLMGRTASHITLEVALQTHPNVTLIGEEIQQRGLTLRQIIKNICDVIATRALQSKHYGVIILPEGLVDFLPDVSKLTSELNELIAQHGGMIANVSAHLTKESASLFASLPQDIANQLLLDRDPHGNIQVSKIESERLVAFLVEQEMTRRKKAGTYKGKLSIVTHFLGYEGRCGIPSNFDACYCYALGQTAGALLASGSTGMIAIVQDLVLPVSEWRIGGMPLTHLMGIERRAGHNKPVIHKALVRLEDAPFQIFDALREQWKYTDNYRNPGSIQYEGTHADAVTMTLAFEQHDTMVEYRKKRKEAANKDESVVETIKHQAHDLVSKL